MKNKIVLIVTIAIASVVSIPTWACTAAGPSTHVGKVLKVDDEKKTFTILDAQTVSPVTFQADGDIIAKVTNAIGTAFVDFNVDGVTLITTNVTFR